VAEELFAERGFAGVAVRDLAERVGLNPASLYNHFESKQALYEAVLERGIRPIYEIVDRAVDPHAAPDNDSLSALTDHLSRHPNLARLIQHEALAGGEHAQRLLSRWLQPVYARASVAIERGLALGGWEREELPLLLMTYHHLIFGHFALADALGKVLGADFRSPEATARHARFLGKLSGKLLGDEKREEDPA
jgi:AcrR family transcriptional regulator